MILDDCQLCQGHNLTYECTVVGGGATVWKGTAFDCPLADDEIVRLYSTVRIIPHKDLKPVMMEL